MCIRDRIWIAKPLIGPVIIAALLAFTLNPLVTWLCNHTRMNHNMAVVVVYTLLAVLLIAAPYIALDELENNHDFLLKGGVFTPDLIENYIAYKRENEVDAVRLRTHPHEFSLYFDS